MDDKFGTPSVLTVALPETQDRSQFKTLRLNNTTPAN